jgi:NAD-dependent deacetylase sirtuin 4
MVCVGENVPSSTSNHAHEVVSEADTIMVIGSSLATWSAFRFIKNAQTNGQRVGILNDGPTRGDDLAHVKLSARASNILPTLFN